MTASFTISYHLGAPHTNEDLAVWSLRKERDLFERHGVLVPRPRVYRNPIVRAAADFRGAASSQEFRTDFIAELMGDVPLGRLERLVMSFEEFLCVPSLILEGGGLYTRAGDKTAWMRNLFPDNPCEFQLAISNPAVFIPEVVAARKQQDYEEFVSGTNLIDVRWSDVVARIRAANPDCPLTVWCNEDSPMIWGSVLHEISGLDAQVPLSGALDIANRIMTEEGGDRLHAYLADRPFLNEVQRRRVIAIFLEKYADEAEIVSEIDLPGWTEETVDVLTELYEEDLFAIQRIPGVNFITP